MAQDDSIKVLVVTIPRHADRQNHIRKQFERLQIPFEFIFGVDAEECGLNELHTMFDTEKSRRYYSRVYGSRKELYPGEMGCALSHALAHRTIVERNYLRTVILEDDVILSSDFHLLLESLSGLGNGGLAIKLDQMRSGQKALSNYPKDESRKSFSRRALGNGSFFYFRTLKSCWMAAGYYLDLRAAEKIHRITRKPYLVADEWEKFRCHVRFRVLNRVVVAQNRSEFATSIGKRGTSPKPSGLQQLARFVKRIVFRSGAVLASLVH